MNTDKTWERPKLIWSDDALCFYLLRLRLHFVSNVLFFVFYVLYLGFKFKFVILNHPRVFV